jgi:hypothetical protein
MSLLSRRGFLGLTLPALSFAAPVLSMAQVAWVKDFDTALKQAAKEDKFVVLDMSTTW